MLIPLQKLRLVQHLSNKGNINIQKIAEKPLLFFVFKTMDFGEKSCILIYRLLLK